MQNQEGKQHIGEETGPADLGSGWDGNKGRWQCDEEMSDRARSDCGKPQLPKSIDFYYLQLFFFFLRKWKNKLVFQEQFRDVPGWIKDGRDWRQEDHLESYRGGPGMREQ